jgi:hypothetical protein
MARTLIRGDRFHAGYFVFVRGLAPAQTPASDEAVLARLGLGATGCGCRGARSS